MEVNMQGNNEPLPIQPNQDNIMFSDIDDIEDEPTQKKPSKLWRNLSLTILPAAAILLFMSRPIIGYLSREACYYVQGQAPVPEYNPLKWAQFAWHGSTTFYKCEWMGHIGFDWPNIVDWLSQRGSSVVTSLGGYATWKSLSTCLKKKTMSKEEKDRLRELAQCIQVKETRGETTPNEVYFTEALRFSKSPNHAQRDERFDFHVGEDSSFSREGIQLMSRAFK